MKTTTNRGQLVTEALWYEPVYYDVANTKLLGQFNGCGGISKYSIAGKWPILSNDRWFTGFSINGKRPGITHQKRVTVMGRMMEIDYGRLPESDVSLTISQYCGDDDNAMYIRMIFENHGEKEAELWVRQGFELDVQSYLLTKLVTQHDTDTFKESEEWNDSQTSWSMRVGHDYAVCVECSHPVFNYQRYGRSLVLDYSRIVGRGEKAELVWCISDMVTRDTSIEEGSRKALEQSKRYSHNLLQMFHSDDEMLNALAISCFNVSLSSFKRTDGGFAGFYAGVNYQSPSRTYFRDGYWTMLPILPFQPQWVREQIMTLAQGIDEDGSCPSAVIYNEAEEKYEPFWHDHYDSPSFFVMMIHDYLAWTHDRELLQKAVHNRTILQLLQLILNKHQGQLLKKPNNRHDWCDNVDREGLVTYDILLQIHATRCMSAIAGFVGNPDEQATWKERAMSLELEVQSKLWKDNGGFINYINSNGRAETNVTIEQSLAAVLNIGTDRDQHVLLDECTRWLETPNNIEQPYGDWGVMVAYPFYSHVDHLVEKTMDPFRYHNGSDWPYWDGILAWAKLRLGRSDWRYPLTRWFTYSLERQWLTPVEYYNPIRGKGSDLQGWSAMPVAAMLYGGLGLGQTLTEGFRASVPPWGDCKVKGLHFRGKVYDLAIIGSTVKISTRNEGV